MPFPPSPEPSSDPLAFLPPAHTPAADIGEASSVAADTAGASPSSPDGTDPVDHPAAFSPKSLSNLSSHTPVYAALAMAFLRSSGNTDDPVVNVWYDLDMVTEVRDPELFMKECDLLDQLVCHCFSLLSRSNDSDRLRLYYEGLREISGGTVRPTTVTQSEKSLVLSRKGASRSTSSRASFRYPRSTINPHISSRSEPITRLRSTLSYAVPRIRYTTFKCRSALVLKTTRRRTTLPDGAAPRRNPA